MAKASETRTKHPDEVRTAAVSFEHILSPGELLVGPPTVSFSPSGLSVSNVQVNSVPVEIEGDSVPTGMAVQFTVAGGSHGKKYTGTAQCSTDGAPTQSPIVVFSLFVSDQG